ncbi:hypothetical protein SS50377_20982 [Spironucleus salmonicida]|uniref:Uncharacterized protein n=1 Tax=Spironucleus salmonicida TaxID=348837 RepID=V6LH66_9EUKA|nr:hypothetical protein SS50377_20979 [Spironucleus salmonicida]KAH0577628.1 hypothetical protein SS50377_20982 [Spironucleus salmonicida]|eukprot:EST43648.1 Hypothetical protein SS50377_16691 [Spironucleus salmonicida]
MNLSSDDSSQEQEAPQSFDLASEAPVVPNPLVSLQSPPAINLNESSSDTVITAPLPPPIIPLPPPPIEITIQPPVTLPQIPLPVQPRRLVDPIRERKPSPKRWGLAYTEIQETRLALQDHSSTVFPTSYIKVKAFSLGMRDPSDQVLNQASFVVQGVVESLLLGIQSGDVTAKALHTQKEKLGIQTTEDFLLYCISNGLVNGK